VRERRQSRYEGDKIREGKYFPMNFSVHFPLVNIIMNTTIILPQAGGGGRGGKGFSSNYR
jgi:hypothetical protein